MLMGGGKCFGGRGVAGFGDILIARKNDYKYSKVITISIGFCIL